MKQTSGFFVRSDGTAYFIDFNCEERWMQSLSDDWDKHYEAYWREEEENRVREFERTGGDWNPNNWDTPKWPSGVELHASMAWVIA